ncbi:MAG: hypothetical protein WBJ33_04520 [Candidatus Nanopelagicales bacterium]
MKSEGSYRNYVALAGCTEAGGPTTTVPPHNGPVAAASLVEQALSLKLNEVLPGEAGVLEDLTFLDFLGEPKVDIDLSNNSEVLDLLDSE